MPDSVWWLALWPCPEEVLAPLGIRPEMTVVDLCCGDGLFTVPLALRCRRVIAMDIDPQMLAATRANVSAAGKTNCAFIAGDAYDVAQLVREPIDLLLMANTFHGVPEKTRLMRAIASILKVDGRFAVVNWHRRPREETTVLGQPRGPKTEMRMEPEDVAAVAAPASLTPERTVELPPYHYAVILKPAGAEPASNGG